MAERAKELKTWIISETTAIIARMLTAWGVEAGQDIVLEGSSLQARQEIEQHKEASVRMLAAWEDWRAVPMRERQRLGFFNFLEHS